MSTCSPPTTASACISWPRSKGSASARRARAARSCRAAASRSAASCRATPAAGCSPRATCRAGTTSPSWSASCAAVSVTGRCMAPRSPSTSTTSPASARASSTPRERDDGDGPTGTRDGSVRRAVLGVHAVEGAAPAAVLGLREVPLAAGPGLRPLPVRRLRVVPPQRQGESALVDDVPPRLLPGISAAPHRRRARAGRRPALHLLSRRPRAQRPPRRHDAGAPLDRRHRQIRRVQPPRLRPVRCLSSLAPEAWESPSLSAREHKSHRFAGFAIASPDKSGGAGWLRGGNALCAGGLEGLKQLGRLEELERVLLNLDVLHNALPIDDEVGALCVVVERALLVRLQRAPRCQHLAAWKVGKEQMLDLVVLRIRVQRPRMISADAHDLGARGLELRQRRVDAANLLRSGARECLDESVENDGPLGGEVREFHLLAPGSRKREIRRLVAYLECA